MGIKKKGSLVELAKLERQGQIDLLFTDGVGFKMSPNVPYGWQPVGEQKCIRVSNTKVMNMFGLLSLRGSLKTFNTKENIDVQFVIECIDGIATKIVCPTVMVFDNAPWHTSGKFIEILPKWEEKDLYIMHLPKYSPHLNIIGTLWRKI